MAIHLNVDSCLKDVKDKIAEELLILIEKKCGERIFKESFIAYTFFNKTISIPFYYGVSIGSIRKKRCEFETKNIKNTLVLREEQIIVKDEALNMLSNEGCAVISCYTGFGKTAIAIKIACNIKLPTLIIVNKLVLVDQWVESINKFCENPLIQVITSTNEISSMADFYIVNAQTMNKRTMKDYNHIGFVIVDELHLIMAKVFSQGLFKLAPRYLLGLSATPYRLDGYNSLIDLFYSSKRITRAMVREHTVYVVKTNIKIEYKTASNGKMDWNSVMESQAINEDRNALIVDILCKYKDRTFLVLVKRVSHAKIILNLLLEKNENACSLTGTKRKFDRTTRILIGTTSKVGTGFDFDKLDALMLASDVEAFYVQILGRVFRRQDVIPIVFDLVDDNNVLYKHYLSRKKVYLECGGTIKKYS